MSRFDNRVAVLGESYAADIEEEGWLKFKSYSDVGLPLAYLLFSEIVEVTSDTREVIEDYIDRTYELLMDVLSVPELDRNSFADFDEVISYFKNK